MAWREVMGSMAILSETHTWLSYGWRYSGSFLKATVTQVVWPRFCLHKNNLGQRAFVQKVINCHSCSAGRLINMHTIQYIYIFWKKNDVFKNWKPYKIRAIGWGLLWSKHKGGWWNAEEFAFKVLGQDKASQIPRVGGSSVASDSRPESPEVGFLKEHMAQVFM